VNRKEKTRARWPRAFAACGIVLLVVLLTPALAASLLRPGVSRGVETRNSAYATQNPDPNARREAQIRWAEEEGADASLETCSGIGIDRLAEVYGVQPVPAVVARAYAEKNFEPAFRSAPYEGCLEALLGNGG